jgi:hypothetical protein
VTGIWSSAALAQLSAVQVAGAGIPAGQVDAPSQPSSQALFGTTLMIGDVLNGWRDYVDASCNANQFAQCTVDPNTSTQLVPDTTFRRLQLGGQNPNPLLACGPFCQVGQVSALDASGTLFLTANDKGNGGVLHQTQAGLYRIIFPTGFDQIGAKFGLGGNGPTAVTVEVPGSTVLFGNLNNGSILRFHCAYSLFGDPCQSVETVGGNPNGAKSRGFALVGPDLYIAHEQGLARVRNVTACSNNQGGCGNAVPFNDGLQGQNHSGITTDGVDNLYMTVGSSVYQYTLSTNTKTLLSTGYSFCAARTNLIYLSGGSLWWGDDKTCGAKPGTGRLWRATLP